MQARKIAAAGTIALMAGCASGPDANPQAQCQYFAREEGFEWIRNAGSEPATGGGTAVTMDLKDALGRPFSAVCVYADGKKRWGGPLPANAMTRQQGRDTMATPPARK
jgi:hypothetical protein